MGAVRRLPALVLLLCAVWLVPDAAAQTTDLEQTVAQFYPEHLKPADEAERQSCYATMSRTGSNEPALVLAVYADRTTGAVRVLQRNARGEMEIAFDGRDRWPLPGTRNGCIIDLHDLDFDGRQEALVSFRAVRSAVGWMFKWDGSTLTSLTPTDRSSGREASSLLDPVVWDLDHKGPLRLIAAREVASTAPGVPARTPAFVYRLGPNGYEEDSSLLVVAGYRADVDPRGNQRAFRIIGDSSAPYRLRVINGDRFGRNRVAGAIVRLNEETVITPVQVNERTEFTTLLLPSLLIQNRITATLTGAPEAFIIVVVEDSTER